MNIDPIDILYFKRVQASYCLTCVDIETPNQICHADDVEYI